MSKPFFAAYRNPDGTYDGVRLFSELTGLSKAEVKWMFERMKHLMHVEGLSPDEAKERVKEEAKAKPWLHPAQDQAGGQQT